MTCKKLGVRHLMASLLFLAGFVTYGMRNNMSVAIVAMTDQNDTSTNHTIFDWNDHQRSTILGSFFWGYIITQIPSGLLAQKFGPKWLIFASIFITVILVLFTPLAASSGGWGAVCAVRILEGLVQGFLYPAIHCSLSKWAPPDERGLMSTMTYAGNQAGAIVAMAVSGVLADSSGWPSIFYVFGGIGLAWCVLWVFLSSDDPDTHRFISPEEKEYIKIAIGNAPMKKQLKTPWLELLRSGPMWAILVAHCFESWGYWTLMTEMPTYMRYVLNYSISDNGVLSALPYLVNAILCFVFGFIADQIVSRRYVSLIVSRKIFNTIGFWGPGIALAILGYVPNDKPGAGVALLAISVGLNAGIYAGYQVNHIDLSPNFAGTMMGVTNCLANVMPIIALQVIQQIVTDSGSTEQWRVVFWIASSLYLSGNIVFLIFGSADIQPWDDPNYKRTRRNSSSTTNTTYEPTV